MILSRSIVLLGVIGALGFSDVARADSCKDLYYSSLRNARRAAAVATSDGIPILGKHPHGFACAVGRSITLGPAKSEAIRLCQNVLVQHHASGRCQIVDSHM